MTEKQRISYVPLEEMDAGDADGDGALRARRHAAPESSAVRAHVPAALLVFRQLWRDLFHDGVVEHAIKELCRLYVSRSVKCEYCGNQRSEQGARAAGWTRTSTTTCCNFEKSRLRRAAEGRARLRGGDRLAPRRPTTRSGSACTRTSASRSWSSSAA